MAKCEKCGKKGFFLKVNSAGFCENCQIKDDHSKLQSKLTETEKNLASAEKKLTSILSLNKQLQYSLQRKMPSDEFIREAEILLAEKREADIRCLSMRDLKQRFEQTKKAIKELVKSYQGIYSSKINETIYELVALALESELHNTLHELKYDKLEKAKKQMQAIIAKYQKIASDGNRVIAPILSEFIGKIEYLYLDAISIEYEYYVRKEREREEQRAIREQMRQEAAELKKLEQERKKVEQEQEKYNAELKKLNTQIENESDPSRITTLKQRTLEIQEQLEAVNQQKEDIVKLQNGKAGYVYVISNLGSFGSDVFKVGMTRRIDPEERIKELGDASVPFPFDVHSFIFSDNAPVLESALHEALKERRMNKINARKEFFRVTVDELEQLVYSIQPSAEFSRTLVAEQYYQSLQ